MTVDRILRLSIPVTDQDRAKRFYAETLGLEILGDTPVPMAPGARWIELAPPGAATSLVLTTWLGMDAGSLKGLMLETADVEASVTRLKQAGVAVDGPHATPWGMQASFDDPDGNGLVLAGSTPQGS
jgi:catechol 2,3-dioxygenase-like lactoylglutathione lyase family enzyme